MSDNDIDFKDKMVLDLGCGAGVIGLIALYKNSFVHFQDYVGIVIATCNDDLHNIVYIRELCYRT